MSRAPVVPNTPQEPTTTEGGKTLVIALGAAAGAAVAGYVIYRFLNKKEKSTPGETPREIARVGTTLDAQTPLTPTQESITYSHRTATTDYNTWATWSEAKLGFKFKYPASFKVDTTNGPSGEIVLVLTLPSMKNRTDIKSYIMIDDQATPIDSESFLRHCLEPVQKTVNTISSIVDREIIVNGHTGHEVEQIVSSGTRSMRMWAVCVAVARKTYVFQFLAPPNDQTVDFEQIRDMIRTFEFKDIPYRGSVRVLSKTGLQVDLPTPGFLVEPYTDANTVLHAETLLLAKPPATITITKKSASAFDTFVSDLEATTTVTLVQSLTILNTPVQVYRYSEIVNDQQVEYFTLCFKHDNVAYVVEVCNPSLSAEDLKRQLSQQLSSIKFEKSSLKEDMLQYTLNDERLKFSIQVPLADTILREHSLQSPLVSFTRKITTNNQTVLMETDVAHFDVALSNKTSEAITHLRKLVTEQMSEQSKSHNYRIISENQVRINGNEAWRIVYVETEPISGAALTLFSTCVPRGEKGYYMVKSYTLQDLYNNEMQELFEYIHNSFKF